MSKNSHPMFVVLGRTLMNIHDEAKFGKRNVNCGRGNWYGFSYRNTAPANTDFHMQCAEEACT